MTFAPESQLQTIGPGSFRESGIKAITIPSNVMIIGSYAFAGCEGLVKIEFEQGSKLERLDEKCFRETKMQEMALPGKLQTIARNAFELCY